MKTLLLIISKVFFSTRILFYFYPFLNLFYNRIFRNNNLLDKMIELHNASLQYKIKDLSNMLIILPHCLQNNLCKHRISGDNINNCQECGACDIGKILEICKAKSISAFVASGGTIARKIIKDIKPSFIIAVACENDLLSGIKYVKKIPTAMVLNSRPNGPCFNTHVDIEKLKNIINRFN